MACGMLALHVSNAWVVANGPTPAHPIPTQPRPTVCHPAEQGLRGEQPVARHHCRHRGVEGPEE